MYIRFGKIKGLAMQKLSQRGAEGVSILITGYRSISNGLIFSDIIGRAGLLIISGLAVKPYFIHHTKITWQGLKSGFKNYKKYPISFAPSSVANALSMHLALFVISANYSEDLTGQFNFVRFVLSLPITFLGQSLSQVLLERFSAKARNRISIKADVLKLTGVLSLLALGFTLPILFFGENLFEYFFGQDWSVAGQFAQVMVCSLSLRFIVSPLSATFNAIDKIKPVATWQWGYFILTISLIPLGKIIEDASSFIFVYAVLDTLAYTVYWIMIYSSVNKFDQEIANEVL